MSRSDRRGAPRTRETPQNRPQKTHINQKTTKNLLFLADLATYLQTFPSVSRRTRSKTQPPAQPPSRSTRNTPKGVEHVEKTQNEKRGFHPRRAHDRCRHHRHPGRHRHPGLLEIYQELQGCRGDGHHEEDG